MADPASLTLWPMLLASLCLGGCASSSNVYPMAPGVFTVTATGDGYTTADRVKDLAYGKAESHCRQQAKQLEIVNEQQARTRMGIDTTLTLQFRCV
jgi:hypothetical protein